MKSGDYAKMQQYMLFKHDPRHRKPILDEEGRMVMREAYIIGGINCDPFNFDTECRELNALYHKNQKKGDIKAHHYIISFDPRDVERGLTPDKVQAIGMEFARKFFAGHQVLVVTHTDGHNHSGNLHVHLTLNSLRKLDVPQEDFMERYIDSRAGYKHHVTRQLLGEMQQTLNAICVREHLHIVDFSVPSNEKVTEAEYWAKQRGQKVLDEVNAALRHNGIAPKRETFETGRERLRKAIDEVLPNAKNWDDYARLLWEEHHIIVYSSRGAAHYQLPDREQPIRGKSLGLMYQDDNLARRFGDLPLSEHPIPEVLFVPSDIRLIVDLQNCAKAKLSMAYSRKVSLSNIQMMARTVSWAVKNNIRSLEEAQECYDDAERRYHEASAALRDTEEKLRDTNASIHHLGCYLSRKKLYGQYQAAEDAEAFLAEHGTELNRYVESVGFLQEKYGETAFPRMEDLKAQKAALVEVRDRQKAEVKARLIEKRGLGNIVYNMCDILGTPKEQRDRYAERRRPPQREQPAPSSKRQKRGEPSL